MDGWMDDGWMDGWMDGGMEGWMDDGWMNGWMEDDTCRAMVVVQKNSSLIRSSCSSTSPYIQTTQDDQKIEIDTYIQSRYDMI